MGFNPKNRKSRLKKYLNSTKKPRKEKSSPDFNSQITSIPSKIFQNRSFSILETLAVYLKEDARLNYRQIGQLLNRNERTIWTCYNRAKQKNFSKAESHPESIDIPLKIFRNRDVSFSEALIKYLKEDLRFSYHQIGVLLNRDDRTIWTLYSRFLKKEKNKLDNRMGKSKKTDKKKETDKKRGEAPE